METTLNNKPTNSWTLSEKEILVKTLGVIADGQKAYGKEISVRGLFEYFTMKLESRYTVAQVVDAIDRYTDSKNDIPSPADIIKILSPEKPRITEAQYVAAQKWQERNGYPVFSDALDTIKAYEKQDKEAARDYRDRVEAIQSVGLKRIT